MQNDRRSELETAYRKHRRGFLAWASKATSSMVDAEDLVQEAFVKALAKAEGLAAVDDLAGWLFTSVRNTVRDLWRRRRTRSRAGEVAVSDALVAEVVDAAGLDPSEIAETSDLMAALYDAIEELPEEQRAVVEAQVFDGLTFEDLAEWTGISADTLMARKRYAVKRLAAALEEWIE